MLQRQEQRERAALPGTLRSCISPPSRFDSSRLIASPSPVPPYLRFVLASACWNASKMMRCFSGGIPMPVSETSNAITTGCVVEAPMFAAPPFAGLVSAQAHATLVGKLECV